MPLVVCRRLERFKNVKPAALKPPLTKTAAAAAAAKSAQAAKAKAKPPEQTFQEAKYLRYLAEHQVPVCVKLIDNEELLGTVEFYDQSFIRLTREGEPNLFVFKHDIKYLYEREK